MNGLPTILAERIGPGRRELEILVPEASPWFEGHFPGHPILPGVAQIAWAVHYAAALRNDAPTPHTLAQVKFKRPILPGARLTLCLSRAPGGDSLQYEYRDAQHSYSSGILDFGSRM